MLLDALEILFIIVPLTMPTLIALGLDLSVAHDLASEVGL
jgi:TRAP-type mannitol/chloroaromatic compound transport system permease large subunit